MSADNQEVLASKSIAREAPKHVTHSISSLLFNIAYTRIWSIGVFRAWEISLWMILAVYLGFHTTGTVLVDLLLARPGYWLLIVLPPFIIPILVQRAYLGISDPTVKVVPLTSRQLLNPAFLAVIVSVLRLFVPILIIAALADIFWRQVGPFLPQIPFWQFWMFAAVRHLQFLVYYIDPVSMPALKQFDLWSRSPLWMQIAAMLFGLAQAVSWITLPIMYGFWVANKYGGKKGIFFAAYYSWLVMPVVLWFMRGHLFPEGFARMFLGQTYDLSGIENIYSMILVGVSGIIATAVFYRMARGSWDRRSG